MRNSFMLAAFALVAVTAALGGPVQAGTLAFSNGQPVWQTTCAEPSPPQTVASVGSNAEADSVNFRVTQYNGYAKLMQAYMDCVSKESESDAAATSRAITNSAQIIIDSAHEKVTAMGVVAQQPIER